MEFIGKPLAGNLLLNAHLGAIDDCVEVKAAIAYAQKGVDQILLFEDCIKRGKKLTFYGRVDGTCPIDLRILQWFLSRKSPNAICKLVPHWLHCKIIWWIGEGAYIGSANLTDRAWFQNFEAGVYLTQEELEHFGVILQLEEYFDGLEQNSFKLDDDEYERQFKLAEQREKLLSELRNLEQDYEDQHLQLKERSSPISVEATQKTKTRRMMAFQKEWLDTLEFIKGVGARAALDENRPSWITGDVPAGVQGDQFLHAYYYQIVKPSSEKNAYLREFAKHRFNPEAALKAALDWWKSGNYNHEHEEHTIYRSSPQLQVLLGEDRILRLSKGEWVTALNGVYAFGDHASKLNNRILGFDTAPGEHAKSSALASILWDQKAANGMSAVEVLAYVIWGNGNIAERLWRASHDPNYKLPHIGTNILGEVIGWARPSVYPPRNSRTNKALRALGFPIEMAD